MFLAYDCNYLVATIAIILYLRHFLDTGNVVKCIEWGLVTTYTLKLTLNY